MHKNVRNLILICAVVNIAAYTGRLSYSSSMVGIMEATGAAKSEAGLVSTFFYFAYGCGQLVNAFFCRRYKPRPVIAGVLLVSVAANILAPIIADVGILKFIWFVNGAAQSVLWCTLIELISKKVPHEHRQKAILAMSLTVAIGTTTIYAISAICMAVGHVFLTFWIAAAICLAAACAWLFVTRVLPQMPDVAPLSTTAAAPGTQKKNRSLSPAALLPFVLFGAFAIGNGFMKDTMVTWVPSLLYDEFALPSSYSVLVTLLLPLLSTCGSAVALTLHRRIKSYNVLQGVLFMGSALAFVGVLLSYQNHIMLTVILFAAANAVLMSAVNNIITSMVPLERGSGAGLFAGVMDAFCYVGSTLSGTVPGLIIEQNGFGALLTILPICAAALAVFALLVTGITSRAEKMRGR